MVFYPYLRVRPHRTDEVESSILVHQAIKTATNHVFEVIEVCKPHTEFESGKNSEGDFMRIEHKNYNERIACIKPLDIIVCGDRHNITMTDKLPDGSYIVHLDNVLSKYE